MGDAPQEWEVMLEFHGGPLDGKVLASDTDPEFDPHKALWLLRLVASSLDVAERQERTPGNLLTWRVPHRLLAKLAIDEQWSDAQKRALMQHYEYHITHFEEADGLVMLKAYYQGCS